jgi:uncharacterized heparinase superfamily protein
LVAIGSAFGQGRQLRFAASAMRRALAYRLHASLLYRWRYLGPVPERLQIAPIDLRTADPTVAEEIYAGRWVFGGEGIDVEGFSVFEAEAPNEEWARELHAFGWLRHLRASDLARARPKARGLVDEWIRSSRRHDAVAWAPDVVARRLCAWLSQAPLLLEGCDYAFYRRFIRSLARQVRHLRRVAYDGPPGLPRLKVMIALAAAALSMSEQSRFVKQAARRLDLELVSQVLPDGGHVSRNPTAILEALTDLLPLRQAFATHGTQPSRVLISAIDRMMPMLRFFRQGDGGFAHFNGVGDTRSDQLATVLAYDDVRANLPTKAPHSGYHRLQADGTVVVVDAGPPPPIDFSLEAHAGCLSFEMSVGAQRLIINCGTAAPANISLRRLARTTAAHSTVTINDTSSCRFLTRTRLGDWLGEAIVDGPVRIEASRKRLEDATDLILSHDGYVERYRLLHRRRLVLTDAGDHLEGVDMFVLPDGSPAKSGKDAFALRFHLHPNVRASLAGDERGARLDLPDGERWEFATDALAIAIEESILLSDTRGNRRATQLVVYGRVQQTPAVSWHLYRTAVATRRLRSGNQEEPQVSG